MSRELDDPADAQQSVDNQHLREAVAAAYEDAARIAETKTDDGSGNMRLQHPWDIAAAIRARAKEGDVRLCDCGYAEWANEIS